MAHEIETHGDQAAFVTARTDAWHRLGTTLPETFTAEEAMNHAHLGGWHVRKEPLQTTVMNESGVTTLDVPGRFATVRDNPFTGSPDFLGVVGNWYEPIQNEEHCDLLNTLVDEGGAHFETAGSLKNGREVFVTMKLPKHIKVGGTDEVETYIAALNSHDGTSAFRLLVTPVRIVCANTQAAALSAAKSQFTIRHTTSVKSNLQQAREALGMTFAYLDEFEDEAEKMIQSSLREVDFTNKARRLFPLDKDGGSRAKDAHDKKILELRELFTGSETNTEIRGTRWAGYQAITEYLDHYMPVRGADGADAESYQRAERAMTAPYIAQLKSKAFHMFATK